MAEQGERVCGWGGGVGGGSFGGGVKHEEEVIKEVFEVVHVFNPTAIGWQSLNWRDEEMHGWVNAGRRREGGHRVGGLVSRGVHVVVKVQSQIEQIILERRKKIK